MQCCAYLLFVFKVICVVNPYMYWPVCVSIAAIDHGLPCHHTDRHVGIRHGQYHGKYTVCVNQVVCKNSACSNESYIIFWMLLKLLILGKSCCLASVLFYTYNACGWILSSSDLKHTPLIILLIDTRWLEMKINFFITYWFSITTVVTDY